MIDPTQNLHAARILFTQLQAKFCAWAQSQGYEIFGDQWKREPAEAAANAASGAGILHSVHLVGLAIDFQIFKDGNWLMQPTVARAVEQIRPLGDYWCSLHPLCRWGGNFHVDPDPDHFSITWQGVQ